MKPFSLGKKLVSQFAAAAALLTAGCDDGGEKAAWWSGERDRIELSQRLELKRFEYDHGSARDFEELQALRAADEPAVAAIADLRVRRAALTGEVLDLEDGSEDFRRSVLAGRRQLAPRETPAELTIPGGRTFHGVSVAAIDDAGVTLRHEHGSVRLACADLDADQRAFFGLDEDFAKSAVARERVAAADYAKSVSNALARQQEKQYRAAERERREAIARQSERIATARLAAASEPPSPLNQPATPFGSVNRRYTRYYDTGYGYGSTYRNYQNSASRVPNPGARPSGYLPGTSPYRGYSRAPSDMPWMRNHTKPVDSTKIISP